MGQKKEDKKIEIMKTSLEIMATNAITFECDKFFNENSFKEVISKLKRAGDDKELIDLSKQSPEYILLVIRVVYVLLKNKDEITKRGYNYGDIDLEEFFKKLLKTIPENSVIEGYEKEIDKRIDFLKRNQAEFENYKKRTENQNKEFIKIASKDIIVKLLPILDNFELALKNVDDKEEFVKGVELIFSQFYSILEQEGLSKIEAKGKKFDPYKHEALLQEEADEEGIVLEELQKGYELNGTVIRHTKVKVSKKKEGENEKGGENAGAK